MGSKTEADKLDSKSFPILEDLAEEEDLNIKVRCGAERPPAVWRCSTAAGTALNCLMSLSEAKYSQLRQAERRVIREGTDGEPAHPVVGVEPGRSAYPAQTLHSFVRVRGSCAPALLWVSPLSFSAGDLCQLLSFGRSSNPSALCFLFPLTRTCMGLFCLFLSFVVEPHT